MSLTARMGSARAQRVFLLAETLNADAVLSAGFVDVVVDDDKVLAEVERIGWEWASGPAEVHGDLKRLFLAAPSGTFESQLEDEAQTLASIAKTADAKEASRRFGKRAVRAFLGR